MTTHTNLRRVTIFAVLLALLAPLAPAEALAAPSSGWTAGAVDRQRPNAAPSTLRAVRVARHAGYDRVVFEFSGGVPGYHAEYVDRPVRACGSGDVVSVRGDGWLRLSLTPAQAHDDRGRVTVARRDLRPRLRNLVQLTQVCDFEGSVEWVFGVGSPNRYRVLELARPSRLVVDILH